MYRLLFAAALERVPPERAHNAVTWLFRAVTALPGVRSALRRRLGPRPELQVRALGRTFPSPLGVAGGMDKEVLSFESLGALGFGFVEVGTVTAFPQRGNHGPRVWRLTEDRALVNRMGFPNPGAAVAASRLRERSGPTIVGVNVGKSKVTPIEAAGADYVRSVRELAPHADFFVLNVSSPNTPGLRALQAAEPLRSLVTDVREELRGQSLPLLLKIGPDLANEQIDAIADLALDLELDGIVATNTSEDHRGLLTQASPGHGQGGVSGAPLKAKSLQVLRRLHERVGGRLVLVSVGGIETAEDVWQRLLAGATLVQAYTGFVYGGPLWASNINRDLLQRIRASEFSSLQELIEERASTSQPPKDRDEPCAQRLREEQPPRGDRLPVVP